MDEEFTNVEDRDKENSRVNYERSVNKKRNGNIIRNKRKF
jgi:hypothetical protein